MNILFTDGSWEDDLYWQRTDKTILHKINQLIREIKRTPFEGLGKPEPLRYQPQGCWSRRINGEHRIVYEVIEDTVRIIACRYHFTCIWMITESHIVTGYMAIMLGHLTYRMVNY